MNPRAVASAAVLAVLLGGGAFAIYVMPDDLPPATEAAAMPSVVREYIEPISGVAVMSYPSTCRTDGATTAAVPGDLFAAFREANGGAAQPLDLRPFSSRLDSEPSGVDPVTLSIRRNQPVVAISRMGVAGERALVCIEVFGALERGFFVITERDPRGRWSAIGEYDAWQESDPTPWDTEPEELPDGTPL